jgi:rhomboid family GlyGly-CTERM serine protease
MMIRSVGAAATFGLATASTLISTVPEWNAVCMDLEDPAAWQIWRPLTGHLAHAGSQHLWLNVLTFCFLGVLRERQVGTRRFILEVAVLALSVALGVRLLHNDWTSYRGLSGIVYGLVPLCLLGEQNRVGPAVVAILVGKSLLEWRLGGWLYERGSLETALGVTYLPGSHVAGLVGGLLLVAVSARRPALSPQLPAIGGQPVAPG